MRTVALFLCLGSFLGLRTVCGAELLTNGDFEIPLPTAPPGWTLDEFFTSEPGAVDTASQIGFADVPGDPGEFGLWLKPWAGGGGAPGRLVNASLAQTVAATPGQDYTFSGFFRWETNYAGRVETLDASSPFGAVPSPTQTFMEIAFLDATDVVIGSPVQLDMRDAQTTDAWELHEMVGTAPAGAASVRVSANMVDGAFNTDPQQSAFFDDFTLIAGTDFGTELLENGFLDEIPSDIPEGWTFTEAPDGINTAELRGFANNTEGGANGVWLRPFVGVLDDPADAIITQTVPGVAGAEYEFSASARWEPNYAGGVDTLEGGATSPTQTLLEMAFLDATESVIGDPVTLDLRTVQTNDNMWHRHAISGVAPEGTEHVRVSGMALDMVVNKDPGQSAFFDDFSLQGPSSLACDLNSDGRVDAADAALMFANWGAAGIGDCNNDGVVDAADAQVMASAWTGDGAVAAANVVPEPSSVMLLLMGAGTLLAAGRRS